MGNKARIAIVVLIVVIVVGCLVWKIFFQKSAEEEAADIVSESIEAATSGVLPSFDTQTNPLEKVPEINPVDKVNPFKDISTNPFE